MEIGLLGDPGGFSERRDQLACTGNELRSVANALAAVISVPASCHETHVIRRGPNGARVSLGYWVPWLNSVRVRAALASDSWR